MSGRFAFRCRGSVSPVRGTPSSPRRVGTPCPRVLAPHAQVVWSGDVMVGTGVPTLQSLCQRTTICERAANRRQEKAAVIR